METLGCLDSGASVFDAESISVLFFPPPYDNLYMSGSAIYTSIKYLLLRLLTYAGGAVFVFRDDFVVKNYHSQFSKYNLQFFNIVAYNCHFICKAS